MIVCSLGTDKTKILIIQVRFLVIEMKHSYRTRGVDYFDCEKESILTQCTTITRYLPIYQALSPCLLYKEFCIYKHSLIKSKPFPRKASFQLITAQPLENKQVPPPRRLCRSNKRIYIARYLWIFHWQSIINHRRGSRQMIVDSREDFITHQDDKNSRLIISELTLEYDAQIFFRQQRSGSYANLIISSNCQDMKVAWLVLSRLGIFVTTALRVRLL